MMGTPDDERGCLHAFAATLICELNKIAEPHTVKTLHRIRKDLHEFLKVSARKESEPTMAGTTNCSVEDMGGNAASRAVTRGNGRRRRSSTTSLLSGLDGQITPINTIKQIMKNAKNISEPGECRSAGPQQTIPQPRQEQQQTSALIGDSTANTTSTTDAAPAQKPCDHVGTAAIEGVPEAKLEDNGGVGQEGGTSSGAAEATSASQTHDDNNTAGVSTKSPSSHGAVVVPVAATQHYSNDLPSDQKQQEQQLQPPPQQHHQQPPAEQNSSSKLVEEDAPSSPKQSLRHRVRKVRRKESRRGEGNLTQPTASTLAGNELSNTLGMFLSEQRSANGGKKSGGDHPRFGGTGTTGSRSPSLRRRELGAGSSSRRLTHGLMQGSAGVTALGAGSAATLRSSPEEGSYPSAGDAIGRTYQLPHSEDQTRSIMCDAATDDATEATTHEKQTKRHHRQGGSLIFGSATTKKRGSPPRGSGGGSFIFGASSSGGGGGLLTPSFLKMVKASTTTTAGRVDEVPEEGGLEAVEEVAGIDQQDPSGRPITVGRSSNLTTTLPPGGTTTAASAAAAVAAVGGEGSDSESGGGQKNSAAVASSSNNVRSRWPKVSMLALKGGNPGRRGQEEQGAGGGGGGADDSSRGGVLPAEAASAKVATTASQGGGGAGGVETADQAGGGAGVAKRYVWELPVILREQQNIIPGGGGDAVGGEEEGGLSLQTDVLAIANDGRHMLHPQGLFRMTWDILLMLLVIYTLATQPLRVGFHNDAFITDNQFLWLLMESGLDVWFLIDVGINFRTGYWDDQTKLLIMNPEEVKRNYLRGGFCLDLLASFPFALFLPDVQGVGLGALRQEVKLFKLLRLARVLRSKTMKKLMTQFHIQPSVVRMFKFIVMFMLVLHVVACGYWYTSIDEGMGTTIWLPTEEQGDAPFEDKYTVAFHWSVCAINGNYLAPETATEQRFTSFVLVIGIVVSASIIGSASTLLANLNAAAVERRQRLDRINAFLQYRKVSVSLQHKIKDFYEYLWQAGRGSQDDEDLFVELPPKLRLQLGLALKEHFIESVPLFKKSTPEFVVALVQRLEPKLATPNEIVMEENTKGHCMFFVNRGSLVVYMGQGEGRVELSSLPMGSFFGEIALLDRLHMRSASVKATTFCDMQSLGKEDFDDFLGAFPFFRKSIVYAAESRFRMSENIAKMQKGHGGKLMGRRQEAGNASSGGEHLGSSKLMKLNRAVTKVQGLLRVQQAVSRRSTMFEQAAHLVEAAEKEYRIQSEPSDDEEESNWWDDGEEDEEEPTALSVVEEGSVPSAPQQDGPNDIRLLPRRPNLSFRGVPTMEEGGGSGTSSTSDNDTSRSSIHGSEGFDALRKRTRHQGGGGGGGGGSSPPRRMNTSSKRKAVVHPRG